MTAPPHNLEAEEAVLGAVLLSDRALRPLLIDEGLRADAFYRDRHQLIFAAMVALADRGEGIDPLTLAGELERRGDLDAAGGAAAIDVLTGSVPSIGNVRLYARRIVAAAEMRRVLAAGHALIAGVEAGDPEAIAEGERLLATRGRDESSATSGDALGDLVFEYLASPELELFRLPWVSLNRGCGGGLRRSQVTALSAWTGHGKSVITDQILAHIKRQYDARVHLYINEMGREERALRNAAREADVSYGRLLLKELTADEHAAVIKALNAGLPFGITDCAGWTAQEIARDLRWRKWDVAAVDILHNIEFRDERDIAAAMQVLVAAAMQAQCHLIVTMHLNETRAREAVLPPPVKRDIRGSGMLKNLAHNVLFVYREQEEIDGEVGYTGLARIYWDKTRSGSGGNQRVRFNGDRQRLDLPVAA